ncbi:hypothetical protein POF50_011780 [Streptomyces sp. SL13]|uniref:DUF6542 domain-containing protein n=1 Tax=Streptantibioticus silvisoli TaxID=2705255 RepID=A0AA90H731_9ACTN|nr:DUF6542 domain-containing protein [Streptantibioticus silvisoli]MDI5964027.1 hypothetical protein [Streptantibioticus silvisoli]MDI5970010.1 hypothetical protein [Streptantibioticus silvisoli]
MEQPRTRIPRPSPEEAGGGGPRLSRSASDRPAAGRPPGRPARPPSRPGGVRPPGRPAARLTGFGTGVVLCVLTLLGGAANRVFSDDLGAFYGVVFVLASVAAACWVRRADLAAAPVGAPIAFALGVAVTGADGGGGFLGFVAATVTGLATQTGWLYTGTVLSAAIATARWFGARRAEAKGRPASG